jgi:hypothetical protein
MTLQGPASVIPSVEVIHNQVATISLPDQSFTTTIASSSAQDLGVSCNRFRVIIYVKTLVVGANTGGQSGPVFYIRAADNSGMSTNLTIVSMPVAGVNIASSTSPSCLEIAGQVPVAGKRYITITVDPSAMGSGSSGTYDAMIFAS